MALVHSQPRKKSSSATGASKPVVSIKTIFGAKCEVLVRTDFMTMVNTGDEVAGKR